MIRKAGIRDFLRAVRPELVEGQTYAIGVVRQAHHERLPNAISLLALVLSLFLLVLSPGLARAQGGLEVLKSSASPEFPLKLNFNLSARSGANINDIRLNYSVDHDIYAQVVSEVFIDFEPSTKVDVEWGWDMRKTGGLPTGADIQYWWTIKDASGNKMDTAPVQIHFDDERYSWQSMAQGQVTVYWYKASQSLVDDVMQTAQQALTELAKDTGARLSKPIRLYIYTSAADLRGSLVFPQEWTGGVAYTDFGTIQIGISPEIMAWARGAIAHELTHLVIHQMTYNAYSEMPIWLIEGLAVYEEGLLSPQFSTALERAVSGNSLLSVKSLASPFSAHADKAILAYAQSHSLVEYLITSYGQGKMLELLNTFRQGSSYDDALTRVYGFNVRGLDSSWRDYVSKRYKEAKVSQNMVPLSTVWLELQVPAWGWG